ncbi:MAG: hypothetical protein ACREUW_15805 [Burkholderiales bacterium]
MLNAVSTADARMNDKIRLAEDDRGGLVVASFDLDRLAPHRPGLMEVAAALGLVRKFILVTAVNQASMDSEVAGLIGARAKLSDRRILRMHPRRVSLCGVVRGAIDAGEDGVRLSCLVHRARTDCAQGTSPFLTTGAAALLQTADCWPLPSAAPRKLKDILAEALGLSAPDLAVTICGLAVATLSSKAAIAGVLYEGMVLLKEQLPKPMLIALAQESVQMLRAPSAASVARGSLAAEIYARAGALVKTAMRSTRA